MIDSRSAVPGARRAGLPWLAVAALVLALALLDSVVAGAQSCTFFDPASAESRTIQQAGGP